MQTNGLAGCRAQRGRRERERARACLQDTAACCRKAVAAGLPARLPAVSVTALTVGAPLGGLRRREARVVGAHADAVGHVVGVSVALDCDQQQHTHTRSSSGSGSGNSSSSSSSSSSGSVHTLRRVERDWGRAVCCASECVWHCGVPAAPSAAWWDSLSWLPLVCSIGTCASSGSKRLDQASAQPACMDING
jgi:hypothetical protein